MFDYQFFRNPFLLTRLTLTSKTIFTFSNAKSPSHFNNDKNCANKKPAGLACIIQL